MDHEIFMREALKEAELAAAIGEVPVGAVVVHEGRIIGRGYNQRELLHDPTAHAEILAMREAAANKGGWRLNGCTIYVTLEPCAMCAGAMLQSRIERVVYGTDDPKGGCAGGLLNILQFPGFNHDVKITGGVLGEASTAMLKEFFQGRRQ